MSSQRGQRADRRRRLLLLGGGTIGFGFGAVIDVVLFHLVFQTHHLLSGFYDPHSVDGLRTNIMYDGLFTLFMLGVMIVGLALVWRVVNRADHRLSGRFLLGAIVVGMGVFNVFDGVVDHYVLDLHNVVHETGVWNPHWVVGSTVLLVAGWLILRSADGYRAGNND